MLKLIILVPAALFGLYYLYVNGYMVTQAKSAVMYTESLKGTKASFTFCRGFTRRVLRFKQSRTYNIEFTPILTKGTVTAELLDSKKNIIFCFDDSASTFELDAHSRAIYYFVVRFESASGKYTLNIK